MNKDVIYIEPEYDITDIIAKIKSAKNKIVAIVPPKKATVLRSAVNFKLIAKTAHQHNKTVVLISADPALIKLAKTVEMPVAKSLQSKPQLSIPDDAKEMDASDDLIADEAPAKKGKHVADDEEDAAIDDAADDATEEAVSSAKNISVRVKSGEVKKRDKTTAEKSEPKSHAVAKKSEPKQDVDIEIDGADEEADEAAKTKGKKSAKNKKVPNFKKFQLPIILGALAAVIIFVFCFWAFTIAPAARVVVSIRTSDKNFSKAVTLTTDKSKENLDKDILYVEKVEVEKTTSANFTATGERNDGNKASGTITIERTSPVIVDEDLKGSAVTIPEGAKFTYNGLTYVAAESVTFDAPVKRTDYDISACTPIADSGYSCNLKRDITAEISVIAAEPGENYNMTAAANGQGWSEGFESITVVKNSDITGGSSKIVKIVTETDIASAEETLDVSGESDAKSELSEKYSDDYILISSTFAADSNNIQTSPAVNQEVKTDQAPKIVKKTKYIMYAVSRETIDSYISTQFADTLGDDTQKVYTTGASKEDTKVRAFLESFKANGDVYTAKLKSTVKTGPIVTEDMLSDKVLGKKIGEAKSLLKSIKGVSEVTIERSYPWVMSIPDDTEKVEFEITVE